MSGLDWVIVVTVGLSVLLATAEGFFFEIFSLAGAVLGYLFAVWGYARWAPWFLPYVKSEAIAQLVSFLTIFFVVLLLAGIAGRIARWAGKAAGLRWIDRLLGAAFGLVRGVVIVTVLVLGLAAFAPGSSVLASSQLGGYFLVLAHGASWVAPSEVRARFRAGVDALRGVTTPDRPAAGPPGGPAGQPAPGHK
jgi:membrane protein required for colicin V production